jgi:hypothetical protein
LKRVVELAGMVAHCDFVEQPTLQTEDGRLRPDLIVHPPGGKTIVVDAKTPLNAYLEALEAPDDESRVRLLDQHATQVRNHIEKLSRKAYTEQFDDAPDFIVLFLPGEVFFSAALERDPTLIEYGADKKIILATPTTLIGLLMAVCYGWQQEKLAHNAREISQLGSELYKRFADMSQHFGRLGKSLNSSVEAFNKAAGQHRDAGAGHGAQVSRSSAPRRWVSISKRCRRWSRSRVSCRRRSCCRDRGGQWPRQRLESVTLPDCSSASLERRRRALSAGVTFAHDPSSCSYRHRYRWRNVAGGGAQIRPPLKHLRPLRFVLQHHLAQERDRRHAMLKQLVVEFLAEKFAPSAFRSLAQLQDHQLPSV